MTWARIVAALALIVTVALSSVASAQEVSADDDRAAREAFQRGQAAFDDGAFEDALTEFQRAWELSHRPALLYNVGVAADRLRRTSQALEAFEQYVDLVPDAPNRREVEGRIRVLREARGREVATQELLQLRSFEGQEQAQTQSATAQPLQPTPAGRDDDSSVLEQWWFWTILGAVVAGGIVATVLLASGTEDPLAGDDGIVIMTLRAP